MNKIDDSQTTILKVSNLIFSISGKIILNDINFELYNKEIVTIIGPNGAGKSSLIKIILNLLNPDTGVVNLASDVRVGYMPQKLNISKLLPISVHRFLKLAVRANSENIHKYVKLLEIEHLLKTEVTSISGGEMQRVLLARALLNEPQLLVLDEPTQGVDISGQADLYKIISDLKDNLGLSVLMVSHDLHLVMSGTDRVICLNKHICCSGHPESVKKNPEFINLFGEQELEKIAIYTHKHDHSHDFKGDIIKGE